VPYLFNDLAGEIDILHEYLIARSAYNALHRGSSRDHVQPTAADTQPVDPDRTQGRHRADLCAGTGIFDGALHQPKYHEEGNAAIRQLTRGLIDLTLQHRGRFFLPYQLHDTGKQLLASYPELPAFLARKREFDPDELFGSTFNRALKAFPTSCDGPQKSVAG
jgi:hypothetical protein